MYEESYTESKVVSFLVSRGVLVADPVYVPVCGTRNPDGKTFVSNGVEAKVGEFPWVVGIYRRSTKTSQMSQICGGSLISLRLVVSAAHCFWDDRTKSQLPKESFKMAIGKYYRDWNVTEDELQLRDVSVLGKPTTNISGWPYLLILVGQNVLGGISDNTIQSLSPPF
ncbi:hypothetical protein PR048_003925 [Dryococelus australis]|uniref:Peptidase S1 domain-containing protein n=1 Tax=Dryococelus australis TaxID=614101 RepID=A0ABQ9IPG0_9NEOP|nr:hypothetical protein PR048_003925 [Dryococelus australis]